MKSPNTLLLPITVQFKTETCLGDEMNLVY